MPLIRLPGPRKEDAAWRTNPLALARIRLSGRSWWSLRYTDGRIINEWDNDPGSPNKHADWPRVPHHGRQALRLYCPDGKMAQLGSSTDATGRLFQFKVACRTIGMGEGTLAHVIGIVEGVDGKCTCYAWDTEQSQLIGPWDDCAWAMKYHNVGCLSATNLGLAEP